ncbi:monocarboxylate transporter 1 [Stomoxys calcitrans]|uniref:monocarboxylate transporter 1 n=1 Tax=Stomoxys calcitrans TaxID=35570 RepID=UPI0027E36779|nr:monocarboxylate transporter 1 [Stomoxys calcitrans]XP_013118781.2 monocarboxylate transporter 1 [Stomoxys calcitrans]XP_059223033.1 monocarboxylate transporter 1 [Stomoxys calcitrans]
MDTNNQLCDQNGASKVLPKKSVKTKKRNKSDLGDKFVAPDGGWAWLVAVASGFNMLVIFAAAHQFGIIFHQHMTELKISNTQLTTIINTQIAVSGLTGIINGPLFRRFSYRQVGLIGSVLSFAGLFACAFADSFLWFIFSFSCCYGFGRSFVISSLTIAINTYFDKQRRAAASYRFGVASLGPIFLPYLATFLMDSYGVKYTMLCFAAFSLNAFVGSLIFQPVKWHVKKEKPEMEVLEKFQVDDDKGNDLSIETRREEELFPKYTKKETEHYQHELHQLNGTRESANNHSLSLTTKEKQVVQGEKEDDPKKPRKSCMSSFVTFFDLDLLRDFSYLNLVIGLTLINFSEMNFVILTPFILKDFGFAMHDIALALSLMGFCDLIIRFLVPVITSKLKLSNKAYFTFGVLAMCVGRFALTFDINFSSMIAIFLWMGFCKSFRTVISSLLIPDHVPLKRLPAAAGIQRVISGAFCMACGPLVGLIRDKTSYGFTLNCFNLLCVLALLLWFMEYLIHKCSKPSVLDKKDFC